MWNCVEDRVGSDKYGRVIRKIIFDDIYADKAAILGQNPISRDAHPKLKSGDKVAFYENCAIKEGNFLLSSEQRAKIDPKSLIGEVLTSEDEIRSFCNSYGLMKSDTTFNSLVIEAYLFLEKKLKCKESLPDNTTSKRLICRKRPSATHDPQSSIIKASRLITTNCGPIPIIPLMPIMATQNMTFNIELPTAPEPLQHQDEIPITKRNSPPSVNIPLLENIGANIEESSQAIKVEPGIIGESVVIAEKEESEIISQSTVVPEVPPDMEWILPNPPTVKVEAGITTQSTVVANIDLPKEEVEPIINSLAPDIDLPKDQFINDEEEEPPSPGESEKITKKISSKKFPRVTMSKLQQCQFPNHKRREGRTVIRCGRCETPICRHHETVLCPNCIAVLDDDIKNA